MAAEYIDRLESLHAEITQYRADISAQISSLYSPVPGSAKLDLKNDPRGAVQVEYIECCRCIMYSLCMKLSCAVGIAK